MSDDDLIGALDRLAAESRAFAKVRLSLTEASAGYERVREEAVRLNDLHEWMTHEAFSAEIPTVAGLAEIKQLDDAIVGSAVRDQRLSAAQLRSALVDLAAWAIGVRMAYETLERL